MGQILLFALIYFTALSIRSQANLSDTDRQEKSWECGLYLAPSLVPGAGLGMFTTKSYKSGEAFTGSGDIIIPFGNEIDDTFLLGALEKYHWEPIVEKNHLNQLSEGRWWYEIVSGLGALPNHDVYHENAFHRDRDRNGPAYDLVHRPHPGTDSFTPFHDLRLYAYKSIQKGAEIFIDYGSHYFDVMDYGIYQHVPNATSYQEAQLIMQNFISRVSKNKTASGDCATNLVVQEEVLRAPACSEEVGEAEILPSTEQLRKSWEHIRSKANLRTQSALPKDILQVLDTNGTQFSLGDASRPITEIQQRGQCIEKLTIAASTILEAGRGAYANVSMKKGDIVSQVTVAQVNRTSLYIQNGRQITNEPSERLLLNYCLGHLKSSLLLCPYITQTMMINHATHMSDPDAPTPNVRLQISSWEHRSEKAFNMSATEIMQHPFAIGVVFDLIATEDIFEGEEIFIDYGSSWQEGWTSHLNVWEPFVSRIKEDYKLSTIVDVDSCRKNQLVYNDQAVVAIPKCIREHAVAMDLIHRPPPPADNDFDVSTGCYYFPRWDMVPDALNVPVSNSDLSSLSKRVVFPWSYATEVGTTAGLFPCVLLAEQENSLGDVDKLYTAIILLDHDSAGFDLNNTQVQLVHSLPRLAIRHITRKWRDHQVVDHHIEFAKNSTTPAPFRHFIEVPDNIFPLLWRDLE